MQLRQLIGSDECLDSRYHDQSNRRGGASLDDMGPMHSGGGGGGGGASGFQRDQTQMATTSGRMTPEGMGVQLRNDPGALDAGNGMLNNLWSNGPGDGGMSMPMGGGGGGGYNGGGGGSMNNTGQMMGPAGDRRPGSLSLSAQHAGMRDNPGSYFHG